jgi:hypothetical protein
MFEWGCPSMRSSISRIGGKWSHGKSFVRSQCSHRNSGTCSNLTCRNAGRNGKDSLTSFRKAAVTTIVLSQLRMLIGGANGPVRLSSRIPPWSRSARPHMSSLPKSPHSGRLSSEYKVMRKRRRSQKKRSTMSKASRCTVRCQALQLPSVLTTMKRWPTLGVRSLARSVWFASVRIDPKNLERY